jgi:hypothetical protein
MRCCLLCWFKNLFQKEKSKMTRIQYSQERQRGYQLMASDGTAAKDEKGNLVFSVVYENDPEPSPPQADQHWVKMWDNDLKHTTEVSRTSRRLMPAPSRTPALSSA